MTSSATRAALVRTAYAEHGAELYRLALAWLHDDGLAQDTVQETMLRAWRAADRFDPTRSSLRTWLYAIERNVIRDQATARRRRPVLLKGGSEEMGQMTDPAEHVISTDLVERALLSLSEQHRTAIVETFLRDRPYREVAAELGVSEGTLRSRVYHGLRHLRTTVDAMEER